MHQYYRDVLSRDFSLPYVGNIKIEFIQQIFKDGMCDTGAALDYLLEAPCGPDAKQDKALKILLMMCCQANAALNIHNPGNQKLPQAVIQSIQSGLMRVVDLSLSEHHVVIAAQLLYRLGNIETVLNLAQQGPNIVKKHAAFQKIMAMIHLMEEHYEQALPYLADLIENPREANDFTTSLMAMSCMFKLGGIPERPVDFSTLQSQEDIGLNDYSIDWLIRPRSRSSAGKPVVFAACDESYFFTHALAFIYSVAATNAGALDLHLHLYNPSPRVIETLRTLERKIPDIQFTATAEYFPADQAGIATEYASRRFMAASVVIETLERPLLCADVDALFRASWKDWMTEDAEKADIVFHDAQFVPFWENILAGIMLIRYSDGGTQFLRRTAKFIHHNLQNGNRLWFLDQIALSACADLIDKNKTHVIKKSGLLDLTHQEGSFLWAVTTTKQGHPKYEDYKKMLLSKFDEVN